jgi:hypothetical protein
MVSGTEQKNSLYTMSLYHGCDKRRLKDSALTPKMDCGQTVMGLTPVTYIPLTLGDQKSNRGIFNIDPKRPHFTKMI